MEVVEGEATIEDVDAFLDELSAIAGEYDCAIQSFDARYVVGREHVKRAVYLANRAFDRGENVARDRGVEILLYAAGQRQINRALELGVSEGERELVVVVDGGEEVAAADAVAGLLAPAETLATAHADEDLVVEYFEITDAERAATDAGLSDLVIERVALLDVNK